MLSPFKSFIIRRGKKTFAETFDDFQPAGKSVPDDLGTLKYPGFDERRKKGQDLRKKIDNCTDPTEKYKLENELAQLHFDHYTLPTQRDWPLHDWPYRGPMPVDTGPPKSHFIKCKGKPVEEYAWLDVSMLMQTIGPIVS